MLHGSSLLSGRIASVVFVGLGVALSACSTKGASTTGNPTSGGVCASLGDKATYTKGDPNGNADVFGAKAAGQARAGRIKAADVQQPAHGRQRVRDGDFVLANSKIAVVIADKGNSDGYYPFGGKILALDLVGADGKMLGLSNFTETIAGFSLYVINPTDVSVMNDGSDGNEAVVRVSGPLAPIPFLMESFGGLFPSEYNGLQGAYEYHLAKDSEKVTVYSGFVNNGEMDIDVGSLDHTASDEYFGFFQGSHNQSVTAERGYDDPPSSTVDYVGFDGGAVGFAYQGVNGEQLEYGGLSQSGFTLFTGPGFVASACTQMLLPRYQIVVGGPQYDGLRETVRRANGATAWHAISGKVTDSTGKPVDGAYVHATDASGNYLSRTVTAADGTYTIHVPDAGAKLIPQKRGYPATAVSVAASDGTKDLQFQPNGFIHVTAVDAATQSSMPVRIHVIPQTPSAATPASYGYQDEAGGKLWQQFSVTGDEMLAVPPGTYEVMVSHGPEWELLDNPQVVVAAGATVPIAASLVHSVDTTGVMCADFHIHSAQSADSADPVEYKVRGALADGLDIPVSSEHEWVIDFQPVIEKFGMQKWAHGVPSEELTTFRWGHFGVVPLIPKPDQTDSGAMQWVGMDPKAVFAAVKALPEKPTLIVNHPDSSGFQGYFGQVLFDRSVGKGTNELWDGNFDAVEVFNASSLEENRNSSFADWLSMLDAGSNYWAVGSSDCHHLRTCAVGYPRTCLRLGTDDPTAVTNTAVRDAAGQGKATIDGGLFMTVAGPNGAQPGDMVAKTGSATFTVTVQAPSWIQLGNPTLETFVNGKSVKTDPLMPIGTGPAKKFMNTVTVTLDTSKRSYVLFHAKGDGDLAPVLPGNHPFAASNPIFFQ